MDFVAPVATEQKLGQLEKCCISFKYFPTPQKDGFDYNPRLIKEGITRRPKSVEMGEAELTIRATEHDPWFDVEIVRVYGARYTVGDDTMLPRSVVAEVDQAELAPYVGIVCEQFSILTGGAPAAVKQLRYFISSPGIMLVF